MHLKEMTRSTEENSPVEIFAVDYAGVDSREGCNIMGIARANLKECKLIPDSEYVWEVPLHWNLCDAATIPYAYTLVSNSFLRGNQITH